MKVKSNMIVQTKQGNYYYLYLLNDRIVGINLLKRKPKYSFHYTEIEKEKIIAYWSSGVYHSMSNMLRIPKRLFIYWLHKENKLSWVKYYVGEDMEVKK